MSVLPLYLDTVWLFKESLMDPPHLPITRPEEVWRFVSLGSELILSRDLDDSRDVFASLECKCAWEPEHGLQLVFRNGAKISKVGPYDGHVSNASAFDDPSLEGVTYARQPPSLISKV